MKAKIIIDMPKGCEDCPFNSLFFDSEWNIKRGIKSYSCRLHLDKVNVAGSGIPEYCPLEEEKDENNSNERL